MSDRAALLLVAAAVAGALAARPVPLLVGAGLGLVALRLRSAGLLLVGVGLLASGLSARAWAGLDGVEASGVRGTVLLLTDPEPSIGGVRADVALDGRRLELRASGPVAEVVRTELAGASLRVVGRVAPAPPDAPWLVPRHIAGRLTVDRVVEILPAGQPHATANAVRERLARGARSMDPADRALFAGLVIGDDREQSPAQTDAFRGAGLVHLLAVSGQNVAFVLVLLGPLARRLGLWGRFGATVATIALFGLVTRFEPSVLRASAMAAVAAVSTTVGAPLARLRVLALAVTGLLLVDPLLVHAVGFRLSVLAAAAIVLWSDGIAAALPAPRWLAAPTGITLAAQLGVAPVLLTSFGPMPVASVPANLLAVPVAGFVMVWGLTAGLVAGVAGGATAAVLHVPTRLALAWITGVAERAAAAPLGELGAPHLAAIGAGLTLAALARASLRRVGLAIAAAAVLAAVAVAQAPPPLRSAPAPGVVRWHADGTDVVVLGGGGGRATLQAEPTLAALRRAGVGAIALVVVVDEAVPAPVLGAIRGRHRIGGLLAAGSGLDVTSVPAGGIELDVGALRVTIVRGERRLVVEARPVHLG